MSALRFFDKFAKLLDVNWGAIADGQILKRSGSTIIGETGGGGNEAAPIGTVVDFAGPTEPTGWHFCFGQAISRTGIYADLFAVIGTTYGTGNGSTTFNLPDFRGRVGAGKDDMGGAAANRLQSAWGVNGALLGGNGGDQSHLLTLPQIPAHNHLYASFNSSGPSGVAAGGQAYTAAVNTGNAGGGLAHPNVQPTLVVNRIIKYAAASLGPLTPGTGDVVGPAGATDGNLALFDGTTGKQIRMGNRPGGVLLSNPQTAQQGTSVGTTTPWTFSIPAGLLSKDGDALRLSAHTAFGGTAGTRGYRFGFSGNVVYEVIYTGAVQVHYDTIIWVVRMNSGQIRVSGLRTNDGGNANSETSNYTGIDFTTPTNCSFSVFVNAAAGGCTSMHHMTVLEFLPAP